MLRLVALLFLCACRVAFADTIPFEKAIADGRVKAAVTGNGRDSISVHLVNASPDAVTVSIAAGSVFAGESGERQVVLRDLDAKVDASGEADAVLPAAALSAAASPGKDA